jgi:hypothetical protein
LRLAREALEFEMGSGPGVSLAAATSVVRAGRGRGRTGLSDDFLRRVAAEYQDWKRAGERHVVQRLADAYYVNASTASRWVKKCIERGYLKEDDHA